METKESSAQFFLSNLSHEIRTPLNGIIGYTQLLGSTKLDQIQQMYLTSMNHCCIQLIELVNDILDFSKLTSGKVNINNECFALKEIWDEIDSALGYRIKEKKQILRYITDNTPEYIVSDRHKLIQIFINLVSNANKFTGINGFIYVSCEVKDEKTLQFSVEDNGIGICPEDQKKLFTPFEQIQDTLVKNGAGLGLAITKKLVQVLGGSITIESKKDQGSAFRFTIFFQPYEEYKQNIEKNLRLIKDKYILVVDDNIDNRLILSEMLFEYGTKPIICSSAKEALRLISGKRYPFIAILLDICMPDMSGTDLAKNIKEINSDIPIIGISSESDIKSNIFLYILYKPINKTRLLDYLIKTINNSDISQYELNPVEDVKIPVKISQKEIRLLVAEDISYNMDMLVKMLTSLGYSNISTALDGQEAINKIDKEINNKLMFYHILLLDLKMPNKDGFQVAEYIKEKGYKYPKIIVISASVLENDKERCKQAGIKYFLLKPFNMVHLKTALTNILSGTGFS